MARQFWLRHESDRSDAHNDGTIAMPLLGAGLFGESEPAAPPPLAFEDAFGRCYAAIRATLEERTQPGLAVFVVGEAGLEASAWTAADPSEFEAILLGRHNHSDLFLPTDPRLSLRHLAVLLYPVRPERPVRFRVVDLRTATAFADEDAHRLESVEAEGPLMLRCASFAILIFPTSEASGEWPDDPGEAWARVPPSEFVESRTFAPERGLSWIGSGPLPGLGSRPPGSSGSTRATTLPGPVFPALALQAGDTVSGELLVHSEAGRVALRVGAGTLRRGVLLGRYDRCDAATLPALSCDELSRVHLLVLDLDGTYLAVDAASKNGTWLAGRRIRCARLDPGRRLLLAGVAYVEWRFLH